MRSDCAPFISAALALLALTGCDDRTPAPNAADTARFENPNAARTQPWLSDFKIGTAADATAPIQPATEFAPGEPIQLSMSVEDAPVGAAVSTHWYAPDGRALSYETKAVADDQKRLRFTQDNTVDWQPGQYRAEIWVAGEKLKDQNFKIASG